MATSILEQISANVLTTVASVTIANGYEQTVTAERRQQRYAETAQPIRDKNVVIYQDVPVLDEGVPQGHIGWYQPYWLECYVLEDEGSGTAVDTRVNSIRADVEKALLVDRHRGTLAVDTDIEAPAAIEDENGATLGVAVRAVVRYRTLESDPYTQ